MQEKKIEKSSRKTLLVMLCTLGTRLLGFLRIGVINAIFGDKGSADVINGVFNIPNTLRKLFAEGALSAAFIPVLSGALLEDQTAARPRKIVRNLITLLLIILVPLNILFIVFAGPLMQLLVPFPDPEKIALAVPLFRFLSSYILMISLAAILMGVLNSHNIFVPSALAPLLFSVCVISALIFLHPKLKLYSLAVGVIAGGLAQILFQLPFFLKAGYDFKPDRNFDNPDFRLLLKQYLPILAGSVVAAVNQLIANSFAAGLGDGSVTAFSNAIVMWQFPFGIFSASITTVLFPRMSRQVVQQDLEGVRESIAHGIGFMLITLAPATVGFMLFGREIIALAYQRGEFSAQGSLLAGQVLFYYALGMFSVGAYTFFQRYFYAMKDYLTPLKISILIVVIDIILSLWLKETPLRVAGLALANSVAFSAGLVIIGLLARKRLLRINGRYLAVIAFKVSLSMLVMTLLLLGFKRLTAGSWTSGSSFQNALLMAGAIALGVVSALGMYLLCRVKIVLEMINRRMAK